MPPFCYQEFPFAAGKTFHIGSDLEFSGQK